MPYLGYVAVKVECPNGQDLNRVREYFSEQRVLVEELEDSESYTTPYAWLRFGDWGPCARTPSFSDEFICEEACAGENGPVVDFFEGLVKRVPAVSFHVAARGRHTCR